MRWFGRSALLAVVVLAIAAGVAYAADQTIYAAPESQYVNPSITIDEGGKVTFSNLDTATHDVTADTYGPDGKRLFASATIGAGQSAPIAGTEYLTTGDYAFHCSVHSFMQGTIHVTGNGTPAQRPGSGSSPPPSSPSNGDKTAPTLKLKLLDTRKAAVRKRRALQVSVTTDEPATVGLSATSGKTTVASGSARLSKAGTKKVSIKLTKAGLRLTKRPGTLKITLSGRAADAAGNTSSASTSGRLR